MTWKMLTDKRGPLQGVTVESIVRTAYGPNARYLEGEGDEGVGAIVRPWADDDLETLDVVIEMHEES